MGAGTRTAFVAGSTSLLLNIQSPSRRRQVRHDALLGTGPMRGLVRPCQPTRARARATLLTGSAAVVGGLVVVVVVIVGGGGGLLKKSGGRYETTVSRSSVSGRRRLNS